jgi:TPR repeat protein
MPHNILMSKIRCYNPNKSHAALKNLNYIVYIGTRPGVDLTDVKLDELTAITEEDITPDEPSANSQYIYYIAKRQNSQGLFGNFEFNNITEVAHEVRDITDAGVNVYRGIVSLSEEDAVALGYNKKDAWVKYMHSVMNDVGNSFGIPLTALKWCAAVHMEQEHPHCHYTFWRTDGKVMSSYIHVSKQNEIREFLSGQMFKAEREMFIPEKNQYRDATIGAARSFMNSLDIDFNHIPERITQQQLQHMSSDLIELVNFLPGSGSLKYKLLPPKCKILVDKVVEDVIQIPAVNKEYTAYMKAVSDISTTYSGSTNHQATNQTVADEDIRKRLANSILKSAITLSLIQKKNLSGELSSPLHNDNLQVNSVHLYDEDSPQVNSVHLYDEDSSQVNSVHLYDEDNPQVNSVHLYDEDSSQVNSVHLSDEEFFRMSSSYLSNEDIPQMNSVHLSDEEFLRMSSNYLSDEDDSQVNSVHLYDEDTPQVNSVHLINGKICDNVKQPKLEWTAAFKRTRNSLYSLDKEDPNYTTQFNTILDALISYHNQGYLPATYLLARLYNSKSYPIYDKEISDKLYTLSYNNFKNIFNHPELYISGDEKKHAPTPEQQKRFLSYHLGKMSERGLGCEINYNDAISYYKNCLDDNAYAQYALANIYLGKKTTPLTPELYAKSLELLKSASSKNPYAAYEYAKHLERPIFPYRSTQNDIHIFYRTALDGFLIEKNNDTNLDGSILYKIGKLYYEGKGCERDVELAYKYFMKSAECKNKNAYYALGKTCSDKTSPHYDPVRAEQYYIKAYNEYTDSETGESHAPSYLKIAMADLYANQKNDKIYDIDKAIDIYKECIETNADSMAMFKLGSLYLKGKGVEKDIELGLHYLNNAIDGGNSFAKVTLADFYADSTHSRYNITKAIQLYKDCIKNDSDSYSMSRLGSIYLFGHGVDKDEALGLKYLNDAVANGNEHAKKTIEFYNNMKHSMAISASFSLAYHFLSALSDRRNQNHLLLIHSKSTSKEARIDAYKKSKEHSSPDFEH